MSNVYLPDESRARFGMVSCDVEAVPVVHKISRIPQILHIARAAFRLPLDAILATLDRRVSCQSRACDFIG